MNLRVLAEKETFTSGSKILDPISFLFLMLSTLSLYCTRWNHHFWLEKHDIIIAALGIHNASLKTMKSIHPLQTRDLIIYIYGNFLNENWKLTVAISVALSDLLADRNWMPAQRRRPRPPDPADLSLARSAYISYPRVRFRSSDQLLTMFVLPCSIARSQRLQ